MATSAQLKALFQSYAEADDPRFFSYAMQIAAHESRIGHADLARELRHIIDTAKEKRQPGSGTRTVPIFQPTGELSKLLTASFPKLRLVDMVLSDEVRTRLQRIIREQLEIERLAAHDLEPRRKFLLIGPPGTGKTMTASVLAGELNLPLFVIRLDGIITKFMGETSAKLRLVFDAIRKQRGVYLFDEFDSIGSMRAAGNDVGEVRRILNSYLQFIDQDTSASLILSATNHPDILDYALFRRFDDVIEYNLPSVSECEALLKNRMATGKPSRMPWKTLSRESDGLSHAEITRAVDDALKETIINKKTSIGKDTVLQMIRERQTYHAKIFKNPSSIHRMRS